MGSARLRSLFCWVLIGLIPGSLLGADSGAAMLYAKGTAWINGSTVPRSSAVFPGDLVQTRPDAVVHINATGSSVMILSDSLVKYEGNAVSVEHGSVSVVTSNSMRTHAGEVTVVPVSDAHTRFEVTDVNGTVQIVAREGDVSVRMEAKPRGWRKASRPRGMIRRTGRRDGERPGARLRRRVEVCWIRLTPLPLAPEQWADSCYGFCYRETIR